MKSKILIIIFSFFVVFPLLSFEIVTLDDIEIDKNEITIFKTPTVNVWYTFYENPYRIVVDLYGAEFNYKLDENGVQIRQIQVNTDFVKSIRTSQFDAGRARVVIDLVSKIDFDVNISNRLVVINLEKEHEISTRPEAVIERQIKPYILKSDFEVVTLDDIEIDKNEITIFKTPTVNVWHTFYENPYRIVVDLYGAEFNYKLDENGVQIRRLQVNTDLVKSIRTSQFETGRARVVIDLLYKIESQVNISNHSVVVTLKPADYLVSRPETVPTPTPTPTPSPKPPLPPTRPTPTPTRPSPDQTPTIPQIVDPLNKTIDVIDLRSVDVKDILMIIANEAGLNLILTEDINEKIHVKLSNVTIGEALDVITYNIDYDYVIQDNQLIIKRSKSEQPHQETRVFYIRFLDLNKVLSNIKSNYSDIEIFKDNETKSLVVSGKSSVLNNISNYINKIDVYSFDSDKINDISYELEVVLIEVQSDYSKKISSDWFDMSSKPLSDNKTLRAGRLEDFIDTLEINANAKRLYISKLNTLNNNRVLFEISEKDILSKNNEQGRRPPSSSSNEIIYLEIIPNAVSQNKISLELRYFVNKARLSQIKSQNFEVIQSEESINITVNNSETVLIDNFIKKFVFKDNESSLFSKIPLLKKFASPINTVHEEKELLLFITPKFIN